MHKIGVTTLAKLNKKREKILLNMECLWQNL